MAIKIRYDEWIKALRPNAKEASDPLLVIEGFIGESSEKGHIRVYTDETLNSFIEVSENDIVHCMELKDSPLGGSKLWVNAEAIYTYGDPVEKKRPKASFLSGDLGGPQYRPYTYYSGCPPTKGSCTAPILCGTRNHNVCGYAAQAEQDLGEAQFSPLPSSPIICNITATRLPLCVQNTVPTPCACLGRTLFFSQPVVNCTRTIINATCYRTCSPLNCPTIIQRTCICPIHTTWTHITPTTPQLGQYQQNVNPFGGATGYEGYDPYQQGM